MESLVGYSKEYFQWVKSVPVFVNRLVPLSPKALFQAVKENAAEEASHIPLWEDFAASLGISTKEIHSHIPLSKTQEAISLFLSSSYEFEAGAAAMYAFEKEIPAISTTKIEGLKVFYGIHDERSLEYFEEHKEVDIAHAEAWAKILLHSQTEEKRLVEQADRSLNAQHLLLDGCYEAYC